MRSPHHLHSVFDVAPLSGFFAVARALASLGILGRLGDSLEAVLLEHLTRDHVNLYLRFMSLSSCSTMPRTAETDACLRPDPGAAEPEVSILLAHAILRLSIKKEENGLRDFPR
jgi:hypothetical protein